MLIKEQMALKQTARGWSEEWSEGSMLEDSTGEVGWGQTGWGPVNHKTS